jgi:hypothetical protein
MADTCREEVLEAIHGLLERRATDRFSVSDIVDEMRALGTSYQEAVIRTHVTTRMCGTAPDQNGVVYSDLRRLDRGLYKLSP